MVPQCPGPKGTRKGTQAGTRVRNRQAGGFPTERYRLMHVFGCCEHATPHPATRQWRFVSALFGFRGLIRLALISNRVGIPAPGPACPAVIFDGGHGHAVSARVSPAAGTDRELQESEVVASHDSFLVDGKDDPPGRWRPLRPMLRSQPVLRTTPAGNVYWRSHNSLRIWNTTQTSRPHMKRLSRLPLASIGSPDSKRNSKATALTSRPRTPPPFTGEIEAAL